MAATSRRPGRRSPTPRTRRGPKSHYTAARSFAELRACNREHDELSKKEPPFQLLLESPAVVRFSKGASKAPTSISQAAFLETGKI